MIFDKITAELIIRALVGGRIPKHNDSLRFIAGEKDQSLGWTLEQTASLTDVDDAIDEIEINWSEILGIPSVFPPEPHIHPEVLCVIPHGSDPNFPRTPGYLTALWVGTVFPINFFDGDYLVKVNFM